MYSRWKMAIDRSLGWDLTTETRGKYNYISIIFMKYICFNKGLSIQTTMSVKGRY